MASISLTQISNGDSLDATTVDNNFDTIASEINGNLDNSNIDTDAAIALSKLAAVAWTDWTPSYSASGSMTYGTVTTTYARYLKVGRAVFFQLQATGTTGGSASTDIYFTLPFTAASASGVFAAFVSDSGTKGGLGFFNSTTQVGVNKYDNSNYGLGAGRIIRCSGVYEATS